MRETGLYRMPLSSCACAFVRPSRDTGNLHLAFAVFCPCGSKARKTVLYCVTFRDLLWFSHTVIPPTTGSECTSAAVVTFLPKHVLACRHCTSSDTITTTDCLPVCGSKYWVPSSDTTSQCFPKHWAFCGLLTIAFMQTTVDHLDIKLWTHLPCRPQSLVVADFGCGDCKIARSVKNKVHSFDLAAVCELVTVCDMAKVSGFLSWLLTWPATLWKCEVIRHTCAPLWCRCRSATPPWTSPCSACHSWEPT